MADEHRWEHEQQDVKPRFIAVLFGSIMVLVLVALGVTAFMVGLLNASEEPPTVPETVLPQAQPRLQPAPRADWLQFQATQETYINSYGVVDAANGVVHIPVEEAMLRLVETGLPTAAPTAESTAETTAEATREPENAGETGDESDRQTPAGDETTEEGEGQAPPAPLVTEEPS